MTREEQIARIIDPLTFELIEHYNSLMDGSEEKTFRGYPQLNEYRDLALSKAREILALMEG